MLLFHLEIPDIILVPLADCFPREELPSSNYAFLLSGLNLICLHSQDVIMVEENRKGKNWEKYEEGGKLYM